MVASAMIVLPESDILATLIECCFFCGGDEKLIIDGAAIMMAHSAIELCAADVLLIILRRADAIYVALGVCRRWRRLALAAIHREIENGSKWNCNIFFHREVPSRNDFEHVRGRRVLREMIRRAPDVISVDMIVDWPPRTAVAILDAALGLSQNGKRMRQWRNLLCGASPPHTDLSPPNQYGTARHSLRDIANILRDKRGPFDWYHVGYIIVNLDQFTADDRDTYAIVATITAIWMRRMQMCHQLYSIFSLCTDEFSSRAPNCAAFLQRMVSRMRTFRIRRTTIYCVRRKPRIQ